MREDPDHEHDDEARKVAELHVDHVGAEREHGPEREGDRRYEQDCRANANQSGPDQETKSPDAIPRV